MDARRSHSRPAFKLGPTLRGNIRGYYHATAVFEDERKELVLAKLFSNLSRGEAAKEWLNELNICWIVSGTCVNILNSIYPRSEDDPCQVILFENALHGDLYSCLRSTKDITLGDKVRMILDISKGLRHIHSLNVIHARLSSQCCFVDSKGTIKIGDFSHAYLQSPVLPNFDPSFSDAWFVPWTAFEILFGTESACSASDLWSLGTVVWEVFAFGQVPFLGECTDRLKKRIRGGELLPLPLFCPPYIHQLMQQCWTHHVSARITLDDLIVEFDAISKSPAAADTSWLNALSNMHNLESDMPVISLDVSDLDEQLAEPPKTCQNCELFSTPTANKGGLGGRFENFSVNLFVPASPSLMPLESDTQDIMNAAILLQSPEPSLVPIQFQSPRLSSKLTPRKTNLGQKYSSSVAPSANSTANALMPVFRVYSFPESRLTIANRVYSTSSLHIKPGHEDSSKHHTTV